MNENFEKDEIIVALRKAAKATRAPKLGVETLLAASSGPTKAPLRERIALARRSTRFSLAGAAAVVAISALTLGSLNSGHANIHISLGAGEQTNGAASTSDKLSGYSPMGGGAMATNRQNYDYQADPALSSETSSGHAYRVDETMTSGALMNKLVDYFDLHGKLEKNTYGPGSAIGDAKFSYNMVDENKSLYVNDALGQFYYNNSSVVGWGPCVREGKANVMVDANLNPVGTTDQPEPETTYCEEHGAYPDTKLPSDADAKAQALKIFADLGLSVSAKDLKLDRYNDPSFATLTATAAVSANGMPSSFEWNVVWANTGGIEQVSGYAVTLVDLGSVATISPKTAVERLSDSRWSAWAESNYMYGAASSGVIYSRGLGDTVDPTSDPDQKRLVVFNINTAKLVLGTITDSNGQMWVLPSYALYGNVANENGIFAGIVLAVEDGLIDLPTMPTVSPLLLPY